MIEVSSAPFDPLATATPTQSPTAGWGVGGKVRENRWRNRLFGYASKSSKLWAFFAYIVSWSPKNVSNTCVVSGSCSRASPSATLFVYLFDMKRRQMLVDCVAQRPTRKHNLERKPLKRALPKRGRTSFWADGMLMECWWNADGMLTAWRYIRKRTGAELLFIAPELQTNKFALLNWGEWTPPAQSA